MAFVIVLLVYDPKNPILYLELVTKVTQILVELQLHPTQATTLYDTILSFTIYEQCFESWILEGSDGIQ